MEPSALFNLIEFDSRILRHSAHAFSQALSSRLQAYGFAQMVADYFWLILGLDAEYFPEQHVESLFGQPFVEFLSSYNDLFSRFGYVFDQEFRPLLESAHSYRRPIQRDDAVRVHGNPIAQGAIRSALISEERITRSASTQTFLSLLNFDPNQLERVMSRGSIQGSTQEGTIDQQTIASGFRDVVSYMRVLIEISRALGREESQEVAKRCEYRLRQLTRWRVNRHAAIDDLFARVALFVNERFLSGAYSEAQVRFDIHTLLDNWGFTHLKAVTA